MISKLEALQLVREFLDGDFKQEEWFKNIQEYKVFAQNTLRGIKEQKLLQNEPF
jgi:hypothetical protein